MSDNALANALVHVNKQKEMEKEIRELRLENHELGVALALEQAANAGYKATITAFRRYHPESPLLEYSGYRFKNGSPKTVERLIYENAFDRFLKIHIGFKNPKDYRQD